MTPDRLHLLMAALAGLALAALAVAVSRHRRRRTEAQAYLRGVRSMLSDDPDAAIEALSGAARLGTPQARETYLALGALFRRTGDLSRAIRLHRNMLADRALAGAARDEVTRELAEDYRRSGMLAEAHDLLAPLARAGGRAAEQLRDVLADRGDWREAAALQGQLATGRPDRLRAHLLAAAARADLAAPPASEMVAGAREVAAEAVAVDPGCAAAWLARAEAEGAGGDGAAALAALARALDAGPRAAALAWPAVARQPDEAEALRLLEARAAAAPGDAALRMLAGRLLHRMGRRAEALGLLREALELDEGGEVTLVLREALRTPGAGGDAPADPGELQARHELAVLALARRARAVRCGRCGAEAAAPAWRCGHCGAFDSLAC